MRSDNNRDWEYDQEDISDNVGRPHGEKLCVALSAVRARVRHHLPVVACGMALGEIGDNHCNEGDEQEPSNELEDILVGASPDGEGQALEEFGDGEFEHPETRHLTC